MENLDNASASTPHPSYPTPQARFNMRPNNPSPIQTPSTAPASATAQAPAPATAQAPAPATAQAPAPATAQALAPATAQAPAPATAQAPAPAPGAPETKKSLAQKIKGLSGWKLLALMIGLAAALTFGAHFIYVMFTTESTDDAFITAHVHTISARVPGTVSEILVDDNYVVKKRTSARQLDPRDYLVNVKIAQANYSKAHKDLGRLDGIHDFLPDEKPVLDQYTAMAMTSEAELQRAVLQFDYATVVAPTDGKIGSRTVETGQQVQAGQALMALVEPNPWIVGNFKESQVDHIRKGQKVKISIDSIGEKDFEGVVDSISPASGSTFSLLPPDNATGNFTKIVQRIPVKILFDANSIKGFEPRLNAGMSAVITIMTH